MSHPIAPSPFVVDSLRPQGTEGRGRTYQLDVNSVTPTIVVGVDELGMPIEESVPHGHWRYMVHPDGNTNRVVLRTSVPATMEPEAVRYEQSEMRDKIQTGWLPLSDCPYTFQWAHVAPSGGALVKVPDGEKDCGGAPDGCKHLKDIIIKRLAASKKKHDAVQQQLKSMKTDEVERLMRSVSDGVGQAIARHIDPKAAAARLREGKGE